MRLTDAVCREAAACPRPRPCVSPNVTPITPPHPRFLSHGVAVRVSALLAPTPRPPSSLSPTPRLDFAGKLTKVRVALARGEVVFNAGNRFGAVPLLAAVSRGHTDVVRCLVMNHAVCTGPLDGSGNTLLHIAVRACNPAILSILLEYGFPDGGVQEALRVQNRRKKVQRVVSGLLLVVQRVVLLLSVMMMMMMMMMVVVVVEVGERMCRELASSCFDTMVTVALAPDTALEAHQIEPEARRERPRVPDLSAINPPSHRH